MMRKVDWQGRAVRRLPSVALKGMSSLIVQLGACQTGSTYTNDSDE
jgi:hypothetical protein